MRNAPTAAPRASLVIALFLAVASTAAGQASAHATRPEESVFAHVDKIFAEWDRTDSPGCALGVIRDGSLVSSRGYGMANLELGVAISPQTVFDIGSTSKQFTAASIVLLASEGRLSLDDDVRKFVPELPRYAHTITLRHLLHHTSGLRDYLELMGMAGQNFEDISTDEDALGLLMRQKALNFEPGEEFLYSNSGFFLLSVVVKRVSGMPLREFARKNIFEPLGMRHTHYHDDHRLIVSNRATGYSPREGGGFDIEMSNFEQTGDGAVMTTVEDLLLWDRNFYDPKVGGPELLRELLSSGVLNSGEKLDYALGLRVASYRGLPAVSHGGSWAGYRAELLRLPKQRFSVICLCNSSHASPSRLARRVTDEYLAKEFPEKAPAEASPASGLRFVSLPAAELERLAGLYRHAESGEVWFLSHKEGKLLASGPAIEFEIRPVARDRFRTVQAGVHIEFVFERSGSGAPRSVEVTPEGEKPRRCESVEAARPTPAQLAEYAGTYLSEELDVAYRFVVEDGKLFLRGKNLPKNPLLPTIADSFIVGDGSLHFTRDPGGRIVGLSVGSGRVRDIGFSRRAAESLAR